MGDRPIKDIDDRLLEENGNDLSDDGIDTEEGSNATVIKLSVDDGDTAAGKGRGKAAADDSTRGASDFDDTSAAGKTKGTVADGASQFSDIKDVDAPKAGGSRTPKNTAQQAGEIWDEKAKKEIDAEREAREIEALEAAAKKREEDIVKAEETANAIKEAIKKTANEEESAPKSNITLKKILGGDFLTAQLVRSQIWLILLITLFTVFYIANRYGCQQDMIEIDRLEKELKDAKYRALTSASKLTEKCRESKVLDMLKENKDSVLHIANQPPYIIVVPEE